MLFDQLDKQVFKGWKVSVQYISTERYDFPSIHIIDDSSSMWN